MRNIASKKSSLSEKVTAAVFFTLFVVIAFASIYPLFWAFNNSLKTFEEYSNINERPNSHEIAKYAFSKLCEDFGKYNHD
jgi:ABC-type glycerol-3-phosphate transport system permease component